MKVLIYPKARVNPYHELLYTQLEKAHPEATFSYISAGPATAILPFILLFRRLQGYDVFHLHWHGFYMPLPFFKHISLWNTLWSLHLIKHLGFKLVWTVHNTLPHEKQTSDDERVTRVTARLAERLIVHSTQAKGELQAIHADTSRAVVVPHGNYDGVYPVALTRDEARARLGAQPDETVVLFFGEIRHYKGVHDTLLPVFTQLSAKHNKLKLVIAGKCTDQTLAATIRHFADTHVNITFMHGIVPDEGVAALFDAADVVCAPFKAISTSGSVILATTFGKPLVVPNLGAVKDIPPDVGVLYNPKEKGALLRALEKTVRSGNRAKMAAASRAYADTLAWDKLAAKTYDVYRGSLAENAGK